MVERVLPDEVDQVLSGVEFGRVDGGMEEVHGHALGQGDFRQQFGQGGFHLVAMDAGVIEDEHDLAEAELSVAQDDQGQHEDDVRRFRFRLELDRGSAAVQVHRQEAVQFLAVAFVAGQGGCGIFLRPGVMSVGGGLQGELVEGDEGGIRGELGSFFSSFLTNSARCPGLAGP
jgi:hypothetical protein